MGHFRSNSRSSPLRKTDVTLRSSQDCVFIANMSTSALPPPSRSPFFSHEDNAGSASSSSFLHANTRGSLDLSPASTNDPFVDPSLRLSFSSTRETDDSSRRPSFASNRRPSEVNRDLASALSEELSPPKPRIDTSGARFQNGGARSAPPAPPSWGQVHNNKSPKEETSPSLMKQFRTGTGWFAPVVVPDAPLTREEREEAERVRIAKLKEGTGPRRPGFIKRMSSGGVEMLGFGSTSPSKKGARDRGASISER